MSAANDTRRGELNAWAGREAQNLWPHAQWASSLEAVSGDASFRRYFRLANSAAGTAAPGSLIAVDAPPATEDSPAFVALAQQLLEAGLRVPRVFAADLQAGWMLLEDFGDRLLLPELKAAASGADERYAEAFDTLIALQRGVAATALPAFDKAALMAEMQLFSNWFCGELLDLALSEDETRLIERTQTQLAHAALAQPQVAVHRDYHSRNLMLLDDGSLGVIDFQDAVAGAYTYDLVSLLRDCYIEWPPGKVRAWAQQFYHRLVAARLHAGRSEAQFLNDFDLMGLQRQMKVLGVFARLHLRDHKSAYLADIPLVMRYFCSVAAQQPQQREFAEWFVARVLPRAQAVLGELGVDCGAAG